MKDAFVDVEFFGCSTAGEIVSGKVLKKSIVGMAFDEATICDFKLEVAQDIKEGADIKSIFKRFG